jgi:hypothetical protein
VPIEEYRLAGLPGRRPGIIDEYDIVIDTRDFLFNSRHLSVRASAFSEGWRIRVFAGDQPATAVVYTVTHESTGDPAAASMHLVHELMTLAQSDVEEGRVRLPV